MNTRLLATKFHIPPCRASEVSRPRLLEQLHAGLGEGRKLTLVSAPAGYGKTTLVAEWVHSIKDGGSRVTWLSLDAADNEPGRFLLYFLAAFQRVAEAIREKMQPLFDLPQTPPVPTLLDALLNELYELPAQEVPVLFVLDDYHVISNRVIHEALEYFVDHQPACVHLAITTRQDPPLPLARLRGRGQMTEIRAQNLRFTPEEASQFFRQAMKLELGDETARILEERTEGWAAGLQLAGIAIQNMTNLSGFLQTFRGSNRYILDYLAEEVLLQQGEEIRAFLAQTCILEPFNAGLCCAVTGQVDAQALIDRLEKANLFIVSLDDERIWYRYHHLFRDYLMTLLTREEQAVLYKKASAWHEANDMLPEAVQYALASGDMIYSAGVIERAVNQNMTWSGGNITLLISWLDALPAQELKDRPSLNLNASRILYLASQFDMAEKHLSEAEDALAALPPTSETEQLLALAALYRGSIAWAHGDIQQALEQTLYAQARLSKGNHLAHARAYFNLGQVYEIADQLDRAVENYLLSSDAAREAGVLFLAIQARCSAAQVQVRQGDLGLAEQACLAAIRFAGGACIPPLGLPNVVLGGIALERNDLEAAKGYLQEGISLSRQGGLMDNAVLGFATLARLHACQGDMPGALSIVQEARVIIETFGAPLMAAHAEAFLSRLLLLAGKKQEVKQWAAGYQANRGKTAAEYEDLTLARFLIASDQLDAVPSLLHPILDKARQAGRYFTCIETMLLLSLFHHANKQPAKAVDWLTQSLTLAAPRGFIRIFLTEGQILSDLLPKTRASAPVFVDNLLKTISLEHGAGISENSRLPEPLSEQELRVLSLIVTGKSNQEIATVLVISVGTAKWHVHNILQKLGVNNRPQAIARARELGLY